MKNVNHGHEPQSKLRVLNDGLCGTDIFRCVYNNEHGRQYVCNFGLPYPSDAQLELFVDHAISFIEELLVKPLAIQMAENKMNFFRFE